MERAPNPNSPVEVRRAIQRAEMASDTVAATLVTHESTYDHASYDTAVGWGDHAGLYDTVGTAAAAVTAHELTYDHASYDTAVGWGDHAGLYEPLGTSDASVTAHELAYDHTSYDTAVGWGDHALAGYISATLTQEEVEDFAGAMVANATGLHTGITITYQDATGDMDFVVDHDTASNYAANEHFLQTAITNVSTALPTGLLKVTTGTGALSVITDSSADWNTAVGWGDHAGLYELLGASDASVTAHELAYDHASYDTAVGWGDHAGLYETTGAIATHTAVVDAHHAKYTDAEAVLAIQGDASWNATEWDTAYGWGDHAGVYVPIADAGKVKVDAAATADYLGAAFNDGALRTGTGITLTDGGNFVTLTTNDGEIVHADLSGYDANDHVDHTGVTLTAGSGLTGGGTIASSRSFAIDFNGLDVDTIVGGDSIAFYDDTGAHHNKTTFTNFNAALDHGALLGLGDDDHTDYHTDARAATWLAANHETTYDHSLIGSGATAVLDDVTFDIGTGVDYWFLYNSTGTALELWSTDVDGGATNGLILSVQDGTDDVVFPGSVDITSSLLTMNGLRVIYEAENGGFTGSLFIGRGGQSLSHTTANEGYGNVGVGRYALNSVTTGYFNAAIGYNSLQNCNTGYMNMAIGHYALASVAGGQQNIAVGYGALRFVVNGGYTVGIGSICARYKADGITQNASSSQSVYIGYNVRTGQTGTLKEVVIGAGAIGRGSNTMVFGTSTNTNIYMFGDLDITGALTVGSFVAGTLSCDNLVASSALAVVAVSGTSVTGDAIYGTSTAGICGHFYRNVFTPAGSPVVLSVHQDNAADSSVVARIQGDGAGDVLQLWSTTSNFARFDNTGEITFTGRVNCGTGLGSTYGVKGSSAGTGNDDGGVYAHNSSSGSGLYAVSASGTGVYSLSYQDRAGHFIRNTATPSTGNEVFRVEQDNSSDSSVAMVIQQDGSGHILEMFDGAASVAFFEDTGVLQTAGYKSSDGTAGATASPDSSVAGRLLNFKNGLYVGYTDP